MTHHYWHAQEYAHHSSAQYQWAQELISKMNIHPKDRLLDIGCGDGKITAELATHCAKAIGIDQSDEMIQVASQHFPKSQHPHLSFRRMDASDLVYDQEFELIFSNSTLHWVQDHRMVLAGIYKALVPNGRCFLRFGGHGTLDAFQPIIDSLITSPFWAPFFESYENGWWFYDDQTYEQWVTQAGLKPISILLQPSHMTYQTRDEFAAWVRTTWHPYLNCLPQSKWERFIWEFIDQYCDQASTEHPLRIPMTRLEIIASK